MAVLNAMSLRIFKNKMKKSPQLLPVHLAENLQILKNMHFICKDKCISDNDTCKSNEGVFGRREIDCAKERLIEILNIMEVTRAVGFMKPRVGLIFFAIDIHLILLMSIYIIMSRFISSTLSILLGNQIKIIMTKKTKVLY